MSAHKPQPAVAEKPKNYGWMAEYVDEHSLLTAARKVRDSGYTKTDAFTPFPVHGIDEALGRDAKENEEWIEGASLQSETASLG